MVHRVFRTTHFGRAFTERVFVSPSVLSKVCPGFGGNGAFRDNDMWQVWQQHACRHVCMHACMHARMYACMYGTLRDKDVWQGTWFVGFLGPTCGPVSFCVKFVHRPQWFV